ncbi:hypothetical protein OG559_00840 [Micromonospora sp. NBC_01405]|uniref:hypothetical protein n=1 Tax=Micromonospora sp. NBC_01405 TaxID=2903589 RepID=UPI003249387A
MFSNDHRPATTRLLVAGAALAAALTLAGCTSTPKVPSAGDVPVGKGDAKAAAEAYAGCLRAEGVQNVMVGPDGYVGPGISIDSAQGNSSPGAVQFDAAAAELFAAAEKVCRAKVSRYEPPRNGDGLDPALAEASRAFAKCARENGIAAFPDPEGASAEMAVPAGTTKEQFFAMFTSCKKTIVPDGDKKGTFVAPNFTGAFDAAWSEELYSRIIDGANS